MDTAPLPPDDLLADLQAMRRALAAKRDDLRESVHGPYDPVRMARIQKEILGLQELCMAIGQSLWDEARHDDDAKAQRK